MEIDAKKGNGKKYRSTAQRYTNYNFPKWLEPLVAFFMSLHPITRWDGGVKENVNLLNFSRLIKLITDPRLERLATGHGTTPMGYIESLLIGLDGDDDHRSGFVHNHVVSKPKHWQEAYSESLEKDKKNGKK